MTLNPVSDVEPQELSLARYGCLALLAKECLLRAANGAAEKVKYQKTPALCAAAVALSSRCGQ
jgi:hypothetical protein